jgi:DNA-binding CsgD family transcriptional regulator
VIVDEAFRDRGPVLASRLVLAMSGLQNAEIAIELGIATNTVKQHMKHIFRKIGVRSRIDALRYLQSERCAL